MSNLEKNKWCFCMIKQDETDKFKFELDMDNVLEIEIVLESIVQEVAFKWMLILDYKWRHKKRLNRRRFIKAEKKA